MVNNKAKPKILIVDDERSNIAALHHILKPDYSIFAAIDGRTAIDIVRQNMPDLILLDIIMPDMSGFEVLSEIKRDDSTRKIPVIIITGLDGMQDEETGFFLGAVDYIVKPFHNSIVKARVKTHLQMAEYIREIERFGMTDTLTGLPNRRSFDSRIKIEWARAFREQEPLSILMIDIDKFKNYNDTYGHTQGDVLLKAISKVFIKSLKRGTDFVARWGGEEFIVLLPNTDLNGAVEVAECIRINVENTDVQCDNQQQTRITVSIGVYTEVPSVEISAESISFEQESSEWNTDGDDSIIVNFISKADKALYAAKNSGRNRVCC